MLDIPISNDMIHEGDESFTLIIVRSSLPIRVSRGSPSMSTVTIVDTTSKDIYSCRWNSYGILNCLLTQCIYSSSVSAVRFNQSTYSVNESDGKVDITLYHSNPSSIDITLKVNSSNDFNGGNCCFGDNYYNFIDNNDYDPGPYTVTIPAGENNVTFSVSITDDNILEQSETFNLIIDRSSLPSGVTSSDPNRVTVTIMDDDCKCTTNL